MSPSRNRRSACDDGRGETGFHAGVLPHADEHGRAALGGDLVVEQTLHAEVDQARHIVIREERFEVGVIGSDVAVRGSDQDLKVLLDERILFHCQRGIRVRVWLYAGRPEVLFGDPMRTH